MPRSVLLALLAGLGGCATPVLNHRYPPLGEFVEVEGQRLHLVDGGPQAAAGDPAPALPPLLLVHGSNSNLRDFEASIAPLLREHTRVISIDRPGFGHSPRHRGAWRNPAEQARLLLAAAAQRGVERPVILGHSWGGSVAMAALVEHPERVRGAVLLSGVAGHWAGAPDFKHRLGGWPLLGPAFAHTLLWPLGSLLLEDAIGDVLAPNPVPTNYTERIAAPLALRGGTFLANARDMRELSEWMQELSPRYREITQPLLLVHGEADTLVPWWNHGQRVLPVVASARAELLPGVGHSPHHAAPEAVAGLLLDWLRGVDPAR